MHHIKNTLQFTQADNLNRRLDEPSAIEIDGFGGVFPVSDVAAFYGDHAEDCAEDGGFEEGVGGEADGDDGAAFADVLLKLESEVFKVGV